MRTILPDRPALKPYRGKPAVRNSRGDDGDVGIIRSPVRAITLPDRGYSTLGLLVDTSAGMWGELLDLQNAVSRFIATLQPDDRVMLASFDERVVVHAEADAGRIASGRRCSS